MPLVNNVNSATSCAINRGAYSALMAKITQKLEGPSSEKKKIAGKKKDLKAWHLEDAARLKKIFDSVQKEQRFSQRQFAEDNSLTDQATVWQYLNGKMKLNVPAAIKFAKGLKCSIVDFSPQLAKEAKELGYPISYKQSSSDLSIGTELQLLADWNALPGGWKYYISHKTRHLREIADKFPDFLRDSIKPIEDDSAYWNWEKKFEADLRTGDLNTKTPSGTSKKSSRLQDPKDIEPQAFEKKPNKGESSK